MKEKILIFIIGLLFGSVIVTGSIYFYKIATDNTNNNQMTQINGGPGSQNNNTPPEMPNNNFESSK